jgi:hypothetical protein
MRWSLDDAARFLSEERGYEKGSGAICWEIWAQIVRGRIKLWRHWKRFNVIGMPLEDGSELVVPSRFRDVCPLEFDRQGRLTLIPTHGTDYFTIECDFATVWPPVLGEALQGVQLRDSAIAYFVALLRADRWKSDAAVKRAQEVYRVGRTTATNARKKHKVRLPDMTPEQRRELIKNYEQEAAKRESN